MLAVLPCRKGVEEKDEGKKDSMDDGESNSVPVDSEAM